MNFKISVNGQGHGDGVVLEMNVIEMSADFDRALDLVNDLGPHAGYEKMAGEYGEKKAGQLLAMVNVLAVIRNATVALHESIELDNLQKVTND